MPPMNTNLHKFVLDKLNERAVPWTDVSRGTGVPYETVKKIASGRTPNPGIKHIQALADFYALREPGVTPTTATPEVAHG